MLPGLEGSKQYRWMRLNGNVVSLDVGDDCVATTDGKPCIVRNILSDGSNTFLIIENFEHVTSFFDYPLLSSSINVFQVDKLTGVCGVIRDVHVSCKCIRLPVSDESFVVLPLLHNA